jgi:hypothetical protein
LQFQVAFFFLFSGNNFAGQSDGFAVVFDKHVDHLGGKPAKKKKWLF